MKTIIILLTLSVASVSFAQAPKLNCYAKQEYPGMHGEPIVKLFDAVKTDLKIVAEESSEGFAVFEATSEIKISEDLKCIGYVKATDQGNGLEADALTVTMKTKLGSFKSGGAYFDRAAIQSEDGVTCSCNLK